MTMAKRQSLEPLYNHAIKFLTGRPVVTTGQLEAEIVRKFGNGLNWENMKSKRRKRWQNLVDWVKAHLTMRHQTEYLVIAQVRYILYLPCFGHIDDNGPICNHDLAM